MDHSTRTRIASLMLAVLALAACGGGGGDAPPPPGGTPPPPPPPPPASGKVTITLNNHVTASDVASGSVYGRIGDRVYSRSEINGGDLLCVGSTGDRTCTVELDAGKTLTLAAVEVSDALLAQIPTGGFTSPDWYKKFWQYVSWSAPCAEPERGVCVLQPASDQTVTLLWKPLAVTNIGYLGLREWKVSIDAPALLGIGSVHTGLRQQKSYAFPAQLGYYCLGGPTPKDCYLVQAPDTAQITLEALPPALPAPPMGATAPLEFRGWGGACMGGAATCTLTALGQQSAWFKWEYYNCISGVGGNTMNNPGWGLSGWKYQSTPADCSLQVP